ncbi:MAG: dehydrogenase [Thiobacillus sp. SCN 63-374]|nr:MAG: dehydrogenase [Thiobacillus sp. SCN 63-374]
MRYMIIVKATSETEAETIPVTADPQLLTDMANYHEQLMKAGVLLDGSGLQPSAQGWRIRYDGDARTVIDGPFAETRELIAGYTLIQVKSRAEAMEWARRFPNPAGRGKPAEIEVRPLYELDDFGLSPEVERMKQMALGGGSAV